MAKRTDHSGMRRGAQALAESLERAGAEVVFGYPGGNVLDIFDAVRSAKFRFVLARHEQGAVHMADGYARTLGRPGTVLVTSGPGLTNTITGLGAANMDGVPIVLICGQVPLSQIGTDAFQEADTTGLTRAVSKHNFLVKSADEIPETIAQAYYIATHGKPGVVVIDIPRDCQQALTKARYPERISLRAYHPEHSASSREVNRLAKLLNVAKRPVIYAGGGVIAAEASRDVTALAHKAQIPVVTSMMGIGSIDEHDELALRMAGLYGNAAANAAIKEADVILALGVRFNDRTTDEKGKFGGKAKIVQVDCDPSSINKNVTVDLGIVADIKDLLTTVNSRIHPNQHSEWVKHLMGLDREAKKRTSGAISPRAVVEAVYKAKNGDIILTTDVGEHQLYAARYFRHVYPRHFLSSGGMGAMGFGIPAAIGAAIARPNHKVVALIGDGGAQMTAEELMVAAELKLPVAFIVFNNGELGLVKRMQEEFVGGRYFATELRNPNFVKLAQAYGIRGMRISAAKNLESEIAKAIRYNGPVLVDVRIGEGG